MAVIEAENAIIITSSGIQYYLPPQLSKLTTQEILFENPNSQSGATSAFAPATHFHFDNLGNIDDTSLSAKLMEYSSRDDVFVPMFLGEIFISTATHQQGIPNLNEKTRDLFKSWGTSLVILIKISGSPIPPGPYFVNGASLRQAWKCYCDPVGAFTTPTVPSSVYQNSYEVPSTTCIPVPSRLYFPKPTASKPLSGFRLAVKDAIDLKGIKTSNCCRAYENLYPPREKTAICLQRLIDLGAIVVGKTKTVQFASGAHPLDWVDTQCPFNPRGDGYQTPSMSSAGSAAAIAAYEWLDFALGTDTLGSVISPASVCGIFGSRPTLGNIELEGVIPVSNLLDTVGFFTRDIELAVTISGELYTQATLKNLEGAPIEIVYPVDLWPSKNAIFQTKIDEFVSQLAEYMKTTVLRLNIQELWNSSGRVPHIPLAEYLQTSLANIQLYDCFHNGSKFRDEYKEQFGAEPYVDPLITYKWELAKQLKIKDYSKAIEEKEAFRSWMTAEIMPPTSKRIFILPADGDLPSYRDQYYGSANDSGKLVQGFGLKPFCLPALLSMPAFAIPIGQYPYQSKVSGKEEILPVSINLIGTAGSEVAVWKFLKEFLTSSPKMSPTVSVGKMAFVDGGKDHL